MNLRFKLAFAALAFSTAAFSQIINTATPDSFQVRYVANLHSGSSFVDIVNTGSTATGTGFITGGNICVQVYAFDNSEELLACCTCTITPNGLASIEVDDTAAGLYGNTETGAAPSSGVIKLVATSLTGSGCVATVEGPLVPGMAAWGTTLHNVEIPAGTVTSNFQLTETPFTESGLSVGEYAHLTTFCQFDQVNGTGQGVCPGCKLTGLGASSSQ
jgi:hypothetical protein